MSKKEKLAQFHQEAIAAVADTLFSTKGIEKTTMDDIANAADYSKATLYVYFKNKEDIHHYIIFKAMKILNDKIKEPITASQDSIEQYYKICYGLSDFSKEHPFYFQSILETIEINAAIRSKSPILNDIYLIGEIINDNIKQVMENGINKGVFKKDLPSLPTSFILWGTLSGIISLGSQKETYIKTTMNMDRDAFLAFGFQMMLSSILK